MIYTVTLNPAIDYTIHADKFQLNAINRSTAENISFGGKGVNVSTILKELGVSSTALGFIAGFTGDAIEKGLKEQAIETDFVRLEKGLTRINIKIRSDDETDLNGQGPDIDGKALDMLFEKLDKISDGDTIVLAGSIPHSLSDDIYEKILEKLQGRNVRTVVDATKNLLVNTLKYKPFLIKPNDIELGEIFGGFPKSAEDVAEYAGKLQEWGARNVLVSMAEKGALLLDENGDTHLCGVCRGVVKNSVGAGDSMVAGFLAGFDRGGYEYALKLGTAAGGATAFSEGLAEKELIEELFAQLYTNAHFDS